MANGAGDSGASSWSSEEDTEAENVAHVCKVHRMTQEHMVNLLTHSPIHESINHKHVNLFRMQVNTDMEGTFSKGAHSLTQPTKREANGMAVVCSQLGKGSKVL